MHLEHRLTLRVLLVTVMKRPCGVPLVVPLSYIGPPLVSMHRRLHTF